MASLSGVSSSNTVSSLMNSANTITGLASGLDTESMIESLVQGYQTKIDQLNQKVTKVEWKQEAYRSIISKMVGVSNKYTSFTSSTNLLSSSFFSSAVKVATKGLYADAVTASGKTTSDISLNAVSQLATAAQYRTSSNLIAGDGKSIEASSGMDMDGKTTLGALNGSMTLTYGTKTVKLTFDQVADVQAMDEIKAKKDAAGETYTEADIMAELINQKLADQKITLSSGNSESATDRIKVTVKDGTISFSDKSTAGNSVFISKVTGNVGDVLGITDAIDNAKEDKDKPSTFSIPTSGLTKQVDNSSYLSGQTMSLSLDGASKTITLPVIGKDADGNMKIKDADGNLLDYNAENYTKVLSDAVQAAFKGKVKVSNTATDGTLQLRFDVQEGSNLIINTDVGETLGIGRTGTSYLNTSKTLGELLDPSVLSALDTVKDKDGNDVLDSKGDPMYAFKINGVTVGNYSKNSTLADLMADINSSDADVKVTYSQTTKNFQFVSKETGADSEIKISGGLAEAMFGSTEPADRGDSSFAETYGCDAWLRDGDALTFSIPGDSSYRCTDITKNTSLNEVVDKLNQSALGVDHTFAYNKYTGQIEAKDKNGATVEFKIETDWGTEVEFDDTYAPSINYTSGQDAKFEVTVNGEVIQMTRSSNSVGIDGLTINLQDTFNGYENADGTPAVDSAGKPKNAVTFKTSVDSDKIVDAIKSLVEDFNAMISEIKLAYSTMPYQTSSGSFANYEPLTESDMEGMTESAIERYEEKAKQGILFGDRTLSTLYEKLRTIFAPEGEDGAYLRAMGISTSYSTGDSIELVTLDEDKLRAMLDSDPDLVADVFTKSDGVMQNLKTQLDAYAKTTGEPKGILIQQSGSPLSSLSLLSNTWQTEIDNLNTQIEKWQDKLATQVDRYTQKFSQLEVLINEMNSQSSALAGMMGGY